MTRAFDSSLMAALANPVVNIVLCVRIARRDGQLIFFAQSTEAFTTLDETGSPQTFAPARGVTVSTIPFELNGATTRVDLTVISTDGGTIDVQDIENGLYDTAVVTISLASRDAQSRPQGVIFNGIMGKMTLTEQGYATIEMVGLLEVAKQYVTEQFTPVCRADFGDARCKVNLNGLDGLGNPITQHVKVAGYDGGYNVTVHGLDAVAAAAVGASATGSITFYANPPSDLVSYFVLNGTGLFPGVLTTATDEAFGNAGASAVGSTLVETLQNIYNFLITSRDPNLAQMSYRVDATTLYVTAVAQGVSGNSLTISAGTVPYAAASGPTLTGGFGKGNYFLNGQIIFRSGLLINEAYEIQASQGGVISLFTPLEFPPQYGDMVDILQGCDHSPFAGGCARFPDPATGVPPNINNYRGEPWAPGDAIAPCQAQPSPLPITGVPAPPSGIASPGGGGAGPEPTGLWAPYFSVATGA